MRMRHEVIPFREAAALKATICIILSPVPLSNASSRFNASQRGFDDASNRVNSFSIVQVKRGYRRRRDPHETHLLADVHHPATSVEAVLKSFSRTYSPDTTESARTRPRPRAYAKQLSEPVNTPSRPARLQQLRDESCSHVVDVNVSLGSSGRRQRVIFLSVRESIT